MKLNNRLPLVLVLLAVMIFSSCGGGGSSSGNGGGGTGGTPNGFVSFAMTDLASDQVESFQVDVTALQLMKADGAIVSVISAPITVDLASLTEATELMNLVAVPPGVYTSASITIDFTNAVCVLVGQSTPAAIVDDSGAPVTGALTLPIQFSQNSLAVIDEEQRLLEFDFALDQSLDVDTVANSVKLEPMLLLRLDGSGKTLFTLGALVSVDTSGHTFVANVGSLHSGVFGNVTYTTDATTIFQVDGVPAQGGAGLSSLAGKAAATWIQVFGTIDASSAHIKAQYVEAGIGTYNGGTDIIEGFITDRVGNPSPGSNVTMSVLGRSNNAAHSAFQYDTTFTVTTSFANTKVVRRFSAQAFDTDSLNVGQHVRVFGTLSGTAMNAATPSSVIRAEPSRVFGTAEGAIASGTLTMDLQQVDFRSQNLFTWADSGTTPPTPSTFTANVGTLGDLLNVTSGTNVEARGFLAPITSGTQDFTANALINLDTLPALIYVKNLPGGLTVNSLISSGQIQLQISGTAVAGEKAILDQGFVGVTTLPPTTTYQPSLTGGLYMIRDKTADSVTAFSSFGSFASTLGLILAHGATLKVFCALGPYDSGTSTMQTTLVSVVVL
jgi:hypothetical protein